MFRITPPSPFTVECETPSTTTRTPNWEDFLELNQNAFNTLASPPPVSDSEIIYEKPIEAPGPMEEEFITYGNEQTYSPDGDFFSNYGENEYFPDFNPDENYDEYVAREAQREAYLANETSQCSQCHSDEDELEEVGSVSTMDSRFAESFYNGEDMSYTNWEANSQMDQAFDADNEINQKVMNFVLQRPDEEKEYIKRIMPDLLSSIRQIQGSNPMPIPLNDDLIGAILKQLIYQKELTLGEERNFLRGMVDDEMSAFQASRPNSMITEDDLMVQKRKEKRAAKGNRNTSNLNHLNENYVSNVFQFAKRNYPQDKDVQRIGNERNVSAANFKKMMKPNLADDIFVRKAKARISGNGKELIGNIENWMNAGYFEQCADREKYIYHKEKALRDLALSGQY